MRPCLVWWYTGTRNTKCPGGSHTFKFNETLILFPGVSELPLGTRTSRRPESRVAGMGSTNSLRGSQGIKMSGGLSYFHLLVPRWKILPLEDIPLILAIGLRIPGTLHAS